MKRAFQLLEIMHLLNIYFETKRIKNDRHTYCNGQTIFVHNFIFK